MAKKVIIISEKDNQKMDETRILLQEIQEKLDYRYWFFGHHHDNKNVTAKDIMLYEQIIQID